MFWMLRDTFSFAMMQILQLAGDWLVKFKIKLYKDNVLPYRLEANRINQVAF